MLVLSRKRGEAITIGNGVTVTVLAVHGDKVKIGDCGSRRSARPSAGNP